MPPPGHNRVKVCWGGLINKELVWRWIDGWDGRIIPRPGLHKLWCPVVRDMSTWSKFGAHGEHGDVFLFSNLGAL